MSLTETTDRSSNSASTKSDDASASMHDEIYSRPPKSTAAQKSETTASKSDDTTTAKAGDADKSNIAPEPKIAPTRPSDPHYVAQTEYDAKNGLKDLNSGKFAQGEADLHKSLNDEKKEGKLIGTAQEGGKNAAESALKGNDKAAEADLTKSMDDMKDNGFTAQARKDDQEAMMQLKDGHKWAAEKDIASGEQVLGNRENRVKTSSSDIKDGLKDFNSGKFSEGEKDIRTGMRTLEPPKIVKDPPPPAAKTQAESTAMPLVHDGIMDVPSAAQLYA